MHTVSAIDERSAMKERAHELLGEKQKADGEVILLAKIAELVKKAAH